MFGVIRDAVEQTPYVALDDAFFLGRPAGPSITKYLGIPYGGAPRFGAPVLVEPYAAGAVRDATAFGPACPQQAIKPPSIFLLQMWYDIVARIARLIYAPPSGAEAEDCLFVNVVKPEKNSGEAFPVVVWIHGEDEPFRYDGTFIVQRSIEIERPILFVSINYRICTAYGFLAGKEVKTAGVGNIGLRDQRLALRWGESSGAISVALQMATNHGDSEGLFRGAIMQSGAPIPVGPIEHGQRYYDALVHDVGCHGRVDTLECLRNVDFGTLRQAVDRSPSFFSYQSLNLAWVPRVDGVFLVDTPQKLVMSGSIANIPMISGSCYDEGTVFALSSSNITTENQTREYITTNYMPAATQTEIDELLELYPQGEVPGWISLFVSPQFARIADLQGDLVFQAPRRFFLKYRSDLQPTWAFLSKRYKSLPLLGAFHGSDLSTVFPFHPSVRETDTGRIADAAIRDGFVDHVIHFINDLDPNAPGKGEAWPLYTSWKRRMLVFRDGPETSVIRDDYRSDAMEVITNLSLKYPL
ncbi:carotenoid ester lipase precursor [Epithele typhae]|uniref:carotenoid ester lipase precursor n=1 Tax=Epithele typhae TaxID=378194 RepID=UPI002008E839|nr:carotenoid ester lipase precursor [Epithele typhae]KAH9941665.1 carotenoid ester lipase precursor [Epithele typhae]